LVIWPQKIRAVTKIGSLRKIIDVHGDVIMEQAVLQLIREGAVKNILEKQRLITRIKGILYLIF
jgi:hypothetical protein